MKVVRVFAVGLLLSAWLMFSTSLSFFQWWLGGAAPVHTLGLAMHALSPPMTEMANMSDLPLAMFVALCLGAGLLASATVYAALEDAIVDGWRSLYPSARRVAL